MASNKQNLIEVNQVINSIIRPERMSAEEAKDFLEDLQEEISEKIDALKDDLKHAETMEQS